MTVELWLVRHGETVWNAAGRISGWTDVALSPRGRLQAAALRPRLEGLAFTSVWASDLQRAMHTAELATGRVPPTDPRLRELHFGVFEGVEWAQMHAKARDALMAFEGWHAPGGEHVEAFEARIEAFCAELGPGRHLLFAHGGVLRALLRHVGEDRFVPPATVAVLDRTGQRLVALHETPPVEPL